MAVSEVIYALGHAEEEDVTHAMFHCVRFAVYGRPSCGSHATIENVAQTAKYCGIVNGFVIEVITEV